MACSGCAERRRQAQRIIEAARERNGETVLDAWQKFKQSGLHDLGKTFIRPARSFYKMPRLKD